MNAEERAAWLVIVALGTVPWLLLAFYYDSARRFLGPQRHRAIPWGTPDVALLLVLFVPQLALALIKLFWPEHELRHSLPATWQIAWLVQFTFPFFLIMARGVRPYQMGVHCSRCGRDAVLGLGSFFLSIPLIALAFLAATLLFEPRRHEVEKLLRDNPSLANYALWSISVVIIAPAIEELLFRGILLPGLERRFGAWQSIVGSSSIFALLHVDAWPAPIPLFVLALFLGYLRYRTNGLVAPIVLHAMFNAANLAALFLATRQ